jgi:hypothetical protein
MILLGKLVVVVSFRTQMTDDLKDTPTKLKLMTLFALKYGECTWECN